MLKRKFALAIARTLKDDWASRKSPRLEFPKAPPAYHGAGRTPVFTAIVADSSYANLEPNYSCGALDVGLNPAFVCTVMWAGQSGSAASSTRSRPPSMPANLGACSLLVIQNRDDQVTPLADGQAMLSPQDSTADVDGASGGHGDAIYEDPKGYAARVIKFLDASFEIKAPACGKRRRIDGGPT